MKCTILLSAICLRILSVDCLFDCSKVVIDGQPVRLSVNHNYIYEINNNSMFNRRGHEWQFNITFNGSDVIDHFGEPVSVWLDNTFERELYFKADHILDYDIPNAKIKVETIEVFCTLLKHNIYYTDFDCFIIVINGGYEEEKVQQWLNFTHNSVFLRPKPSMFSEPLDRLTYGFDVLAINRDNKYERMKIRFNKLFHANKEICGKTNCPVIPFIDGPNSTNKISDQLFRQLDSVVEYRNGSIYGHLLFFNINNRPFYCLQPESQPLSQQV